MSFLRNIRTPPESFPIFAAVGAAVVLSGYVGLRTLAVHNDITFDKKNNAGAYFNEAMPLLVKPQYAESARSEFDRQLTGRQ